MGLPRLILVAFFFICAFSIQVNAAPQAISEHPQYLKSMKLVKEIGRKEVVSNVVELQREQMQDYGGVIDKYSEAVSIIGGNFSITQMTIYKIDSMLKDINEYRTNEGKKIISRAKVTETFQEGGLSSNVQINMLCTNPATRAYIDSGIAYILKVYDEQMTFISEINTDRSACIENDKKQ